MYEDRGIDIGIILKWILNRVYGGGQLMWIFVEVE